MLFSPVAWSLEVVQTGDGKILIKPTTQPDSAKKVPEAVRDPFNWGSEFIDKFEPHPILKVPEDMFAGLELTAILWDDTLPLAVINNTLLQKGDSIEGASVTRIFRDKVLLEKEKQLHVLKFHEIIDLEGLLLQPKGE